MTHLRGYKADAVLIPEPEEEKLVRANVGVVWFQVEVRGHPVHVREMGAGANAIDAAGKALFGMKDGITKYRGEWLQLAVGTATVPVLPAFNPAYLLRMPLHKALAWRDLLAFKAKIDAD